MVNSWKKADILPDSFWEGEGTIRSELLADADKQVAEDYSRTDAMLDELRTYFPNVMTAREYAEELSGEEITVQQPPTAKEFVQHVLQDSSSSEEELEDEEEEVGDEKFENSLAAVEEYVHQKAASCGEKHVGNVFLLKQAHQRRKIEMQLSAQKGQSGIRSFFN